MQMARLVLCACALRWMRAELRVSQSLQAPCQLSKLLELLLHCMSGGLQQHMLLQCAAWQADACPQQLP